MRLLYNANTMHMRASPVDNGTPRRVCLCAQSQHNHSKQQTNLTKKPTPKTYTPTKNRCKPPTQARIAKPLASTRPRESKLSHHSKRPPANNGANPLAFQMIMSSISRSLPPAQQMNEVQISFLSGGPSHSPERGHLWSQPCPSALGRVWSATLAPRLRSGATNPSTAVASSSPTQRHNKAMSGSFLALAHHHKKGYRITKKHPAARLIPRSQHASCAA
ncbi:unnamed protein product, partial [Ectocarpus fasciculatus]